MVNLTLMILLFFTAREKAAHMVHQNSQFRSQYALHLLGEWNVNISLNLYKLRKNMIESLQM